MDQRENSNTAVEVSLVGEGEKGEDAGDGKGGRISNLLELLAEKTLGLLEDLLLLSVVLKDLKAGELRTRSVGAAGDEDQDENEGGE